MHGYEQLVTYLPILQKNTFNLALHYKARKQIVICTEYDLFKTIHSQVTLIFQIVYLLLSKEQTTKVYQHIIEYTVTHGSTILLAKISSTSLPSSLVQKFLSQIVVLI